MTDVDITTLPVDTLDELAVLAYDDDGDVEFIDEPDDENPEHGVNTDAEMDGSREPI